MNDTLWLVTCAIAWEQVDTGNSGIRLKAESGHVGFCPLFESREAALRHFPESTPGEVTVLDDWALVTGAWPIAGEA